MAGHSYLINLSNNLPFIFTFNPPSISDDRTIKYYVASNLGGAFHQKYFSGFDNKEVQFTLILHDNENPNGVMSEVAFFEQLREPDPGLFNIAGSFFGNENYPPPQVLFQYGQGMIPLIWDVLSIGITKSHFYDGNIRGVMGIARRAEIEISLSLDEDNILNKANQVAKKASMLAGSVGSIAKEVLHKIHGKRKEQPGIFPGGIGRNV